MKLLKYTTTNSNYTTLKTTEVYNNVQQVYKYTTTCKPTEVYHLQKACTVKTDTLYINKQGWFYDSHYNTYS